MSKENKEAEIELRIHGMDCAEEVTLLKRELVPLLGDEDRLGFDLLNGKLTADTSSLDVTEVDVLAAIERTGLKSEPWRDDGAASDNQSSWQRKRKQKRNRRSLEPFADQHRSNDGHRHQQIHVRT